MNEQQVAITRYSISAAAPSQPDRRADERFVSLLRVGAIVVEGRRELCLIRNISVGGMMIRAYSEIAAGTPVCVEFKERDPISGTVHWADGELIGIGFDQPIDVLDLLANDAGGPSPRLPRIELQCSAWVRHEARLVRVTALNVSQGGLCVRSETPLDIRSHVVATLPGLSPAPGVVRWSKDDCYGIAFNGRLALPSLVKWLKERQSRGCERLAS